MSMDIKEDNPVSFQRFLPPAFPPQSYSVVVFLPPHTLVQNKVVESVETVQTIGTKSQ